MYVFPTLPDNNNTLGENDNYQNRNIFNGGMIDDNDEINNELKLVKPFNRYETVELNLDL